MLTNSSSDYSDAKLFRVTLHMTEFVYLYMYRWLLRSWAYSTPFQINRNGISDKAKAESVKEGKEKKEQILHTHWQGWGHLKHLSLAEAERSCNSEISVDITK